MLSACCGDCHPIVREKCEKAYEKNKNSENERFIFCNTQDIRLLIEVATV